MKLFIKIVAATSFAFIFSGVSAQDMQDPAPQGAYAANLQQPKPQFDFLRNGSLLTVRSSSGRELTTIDLEKPAIKGKVFAFTYSSKKKRLQSEVGINTMAIFPNPASGQITLQFKGEWNYPVNVQVFDRTGNEVQVSSLESAESPLDITSLRQGIYILRAQSGHAHAAEKLVVE
ncbi:T9SS type A sorting domain-containing protein [Dyadobacter sp. MSC1_007]|jgi:hypothetical protein|uniref:T9SS type A sorting domain-containing protein n=1 Tax=Dyadobacter sp. MSC1_007 TaxID=2909264 RepID=UPI00202DCCCF|nr:T9SS type A sorting domain-containing protein [Dyadobacter sp. MSC1_007]